MKKALALLLALAMVFSLAACGGGNDGGAADAGGNQPADTGSDAPADTGSDSGFKDARSLQAEFPDQVAWNDMSEEELLELAKAEGGDITIYGISSRIEKICDLFNEK